MKMLSFTGIHVVWILKSILLIPVWAFHSALCGICLTWWGFEQSGLGQNVPAHARGVGLSWSLRSLPAQTVPWYCGSACFECQQKLLNSKRTCARPIQLPGLLHRVKTCFQRSGTSASPSSEACPWTHNICLFAAEPQSTCFYFGNRAAPVFVFALR